MLLVIFLCQVTFASDAATLKYRYIALVRKEVTHAPLLVSSADVGPHQVRLLSYYQATMHQALVPVYDDRKISKQFSCLVVHTTKLFFR